MISGARHIPPDVLQVSEQMREMMEWYEGDAQELHLMVRAAMLHSIFVKIHPFIDGNGRTARLLLNLELMKSGYVPIVIQKEKGCITIRRWMNRMLQKIILTSPSWLRAFWTKYVIFTSEL